MVRPIMHSLHLLLSPTMTTAIASVMANRRAGPRFCAIYQGKLATVIFEFLNSGASGPICQLYKFTRTFKILDGHPLDIEIPKLLPFYRAGKVFIKPGKGKSGLPFEAVYPVLALRSEGIAFIC